MIFWVRNVFSTGTLAIKNVVTADVNQRCTGFFCSDDGVGNGPAVRFESMLAAGLTIVDLGEGGAVDHQLRMKGMDPGEERLAIGEIGLLTTERKHRTTL